MVVIDEAHNMRNPSAQRAEALRRLLAGSPPKKLVLLTATPVNNSLWDLYYLLGYFLRNDAAFADMGIPSMRDHFAHAMSLNPDDLTPEHLFEVLDAVAVRRTRSFVKRYYPNDTVPIRGREQVIAFPTPRVLKVSYDLDAVLPGFFDRIAAALDPDGDPDDPDTLTLARYAPSMYRLGEAPEDYEMQLAGLLLSGMLKRFESSPHAFAQTCQRMAASHDSFLTLLEKGRVATGDALADWLATDSDDEEEVDVYLDAHIGVTFDATDYNTARLHRHVARDSRLLHSFAAQAWTVTRRDDPNLAELAEQLACIVAEAETTGIGETDARNKRKVLIFSYFADTVDWICEHLVEVTATDPRLAPYRGRVVSLSGSTAASDKDAAVWGFAPETTDAPSDAKSDRYDILVTTDVLAEGVNLQQARHIINYDLPWNPMRLVQRHGRIDRIGSLHSEVFIRCVFPDSRLDDLLNLKQRLHRKIKQAAASIGISEVLPEQQGSDISFAETREEIERISRGEADLFERGGTARGALSGEEYRQELRQAVENGLREQIENLPWGSGSRMATNTAAVSSQHRRQRQQSGPAYVFCARVGDSERALFRRVELSSRTRPGREAEFTGRTTDKNAPEVGSRADAEGLGKLTTSGAAGSIGTQPGGSTGRGSAPTRAPRPPTVANETTVDHETTVTHETLACLHQARPPDGFNTPRVLGGDTHRRVFEAWEIAKDDIVKRWNHLADKANLEPRVPPAMARAADILRSHPPADVTQDQVDRAIDCLNAPYPERTVRTVRIAVAASPDPAEQADRILSVIQDLGLQPHTPPDALPEITPEDVHLVCWLAIT